MAAPAEHPAPCRTQGRRDITATRHLGSVTQTFRELGVTTAWEQMDLGDGSISSAIRDNYGNLINVLQEGASPTR